MNKLMRRSCFVMVGGLCASLVSGCATGPQTIHSGARDATSLELRRSSAAETPVAKAKAREAEKKQSTQWMPGAPTASMPAPEVSLVSHVTPASASGEPSEPPAPESFSVPREPLGAPPQFVDPTAPVAGSPYRTVGHVRPGPARAALHDAACTSCVGQRYTPTYPQICGNVSGGCSSDCNPGQCMECEPEMRCVDPQEYIYDGGDRDPQVRLRDDMTQAGLDPEDTVIQYTTADGKTLVQSGCRVAIYAPRFGSVRKRTGPMTADLALRPQTNVLPNGPGLVREKLPPVNIMQPVAPVSKDAVRVVEAFRERQSPLPADLVVPMRVLSDAFKPFEDLDIIREGNLQGTDPAKLALAAAAARVWTNVDQLKVLIDGQEAALITDLKQQQEVLTYEFKGARIRLCKVASEQMANPGDVISFTIRFDNVGEQPLRNLVVTDSLAPRLEYVDATQQSSLAASFSTTPNEAGSKVLRWELENELKPGEGGIVRFDAKVR